MYKSKISNWNTETLDIHSSSYHAKDIMQTAADNHVYNEQKYGSFEPSSVYSRNDGMKEEAKKLEEEENTITAKVENELKKNEEEKTENFSSQSMIRAAQMVFSKDAPKAKDANNAETIEEAIKKAIQQEKEVIILS